MQPTNQNPCREIRLLADALGVALLAIQLVLLNIEIAFDKDRRPSQHLTTPVGSLISE
jgi:hypothetical protein